MTEYAIEVSGLKKTYAGGVEALKGVDLTVKKGDFFALLGPNGAGKTTAIGMLVSLITKTAGRVIVSGIDIDKSPGLARSKIGIVPQELNLNMFESLWNVLIQQAGYYGMPRKQAKVRAEKLLKQLGLYGKRHEITRNLSGGMKRRLMIARGMVHEPEVLLLDEPTEGVDVEIRQEMWALLREYNEQGTTIVLTTHYLEEAEDLCRHLAIIHQGKIIQQDTMTGVLEKLEREALVLYLKNALNEAPDLTPFSCQLVEDKVLEVEVDSNLSLNDLFSVLSSQNIAVEGMRNKTNRLEHVFMDLVGTGAKNV